MLQSSQVLSFFRPRENGGDWTQKELAEFYRVEGALVGSGINIATDRGLTDEGEPWFVFYRQDNEEVIVHFARIDGEYVVVSYLNEAVARGHNFQTLVRQLLDSHPYVLPKPSARRQTVYLHPAALLVALVVTGYVKSAELSGATDEQGRAEKSFGWFFNRQDLAAYSAIVMAVVWDSLIADRFENKVGDLALLEDVQSVHELAALTLASHPADAQQLSNDLAFKNGHDDHLLQAEMTVDFAYKASAADVRDSATVASVGSKVVTEQLTSSSSDHDKLATVHQGVRPEKDGNARTADWHSDHEAGDAVVATNQTERVASAKAGTSVTAEQVLEPHNAASSSSSSSAVADVSGAQNLLSSVLHIDPQALRPVVLTVTSLNDAVRTTLLELNVHDTTFATDSDSTTLDWSGLERSSAEVSSGADSFATFDDAAREILNEFLRDTPQYRVEAFGDHFLIADTNASHYVSNEYRLETWAMPDGSKLSILGIVPHHETAMAA